MTTVSEKIAEWLEATNYESIGQEVITIAKRNILDFVGVTLAGSRQPIAEIVKEYLKEVRGVEQSTVIGLSSKTSYIEAAFANALIGHCLDYDDLVVPMAGAGGPHITAVVLPAALAIAEKKGNAGKEVITAYVVGCEIAYRVGRSVDPVHYNLGWHTTGTEGIFGATAAASKLLGLSHEQITYALGIAGSGASGLRENFGTMTKAFHAGEACVKGVKAALLAKLGFTSSTSIFEGKYGFCNVLSQNSRIDEITRNMGQLLCVPEIMLKLYPCCGSSHTAIYAALELANQYDLTIDRVEEIEIECDPQALAVLPYNKPKTALEGKFSMQFPLALALSDRKVTIEQFTDEKVKDPKTIDLMSKVKLTPRPELRGNHPHVRPVVVKIKLRNGSELAKRCDYRPGSPSNPLCNEEIHEKYRSCARLVLAEKEIEDSIKVIMNLERIDNISELMKLLAPKVGRVLCPKTQPCRRKIVYNQGKSEK